MDKQSKNEPVLVQHPESGQFVDVRPFFNLLFQQNTSELDELRLSVDSSIEFTNVYCSLKTDMTGIADIQNNYFFFMYQIKSLLKNTTIFKKEGGAAC